MSAWGKYYNGAGLSSTKAEDRWGRMNSIMQGRAGASTDISRFVKSCSANHIPEFFPVLPRISNGHTCMVPVSEELIVQMNERDMARMPEGCFVSKDDSLTARVWRRLL